jgi:hypothetical protein
MSSKKFIIISFVLGLFLGLAISVNAYRFEKPQRITAFDENNLVILNRVLEQLWDLTNGRYSPDSGLTASTGTGTIKMGSVNNANSVGWIKFTKTDGTAIYIPYWSTDAP